jgi:hypothetical protein
MSSRGPFRTLGTRRILSLATERLTGLKLSRAEKDQAIGGQHEEAEAESLRNTLKAEAVYVTSYDSYAEVAADLPSFIAEVYNAKHLQSALTGC